MSTADRAERILAGVRAIPEGFVRTYGDLSPGAPRLTGRVLSATGDASLPWWRVVRADGSLAKGEHQRSLLDAEGIPFRGARVDLRVARIPSEVIHVAPARDHAAPAPARLPPRDRRGARRDR